MSAEQTVKEAYSADSNPFEALHGWKPRRKNVNYIIASFVGTGKHFLPQRAQNGTGKALLVDNLRSLAYNFARNSLCNETERDDEVWSLTAAMGAWKKP